MTPTSWGLEKGRMVNEAREREMDCARGLNRARCADLWVSPQWHHILENNESL